MTRKIPNINIKEIEEDYLTTNPEDDDETIRLKEAVRRLNQVDRVIFMLYTEFASMRKVGKILGISLSSVHNKIKQIREKILCS